MSHIRAKLAANRETCALFDIARFTRNLEEVYLRMARADPGIKTAA